MTDQFQRQIARYTAPGGANATLIYVLYLSGLLVGVPLIIGLVMAYVARDQAAGWVRTHYDFQIRTFWLGLLFTTIGFLLTFILIGIPILMATVVWFIVRCVKGMGRATYEQPIANPQSWLTGA